MRTGHLISFKLDELSRPLIFAYIMSANNANATQHADGPGLNVAQPAEPPPVRQSNRISNKIVQLTKGTCGEAAARVSLSSPNTSPGDDECHCPDQPSIPIMARQSRGTADGIIYVTDTALQQYVRVTIRGHAMEDNSVFLFILLQKAQH